MENVRNITDIIRGIASGTNLPAMNAAIEAAQAGDAGRSIQQLQQVSGEVSGGARKIA